MSGQSGFCEQKHRDRKKKSFNVIVMSFVPPGAVSSPVIITLFYTEVFYCPQTSLCKHARARASYDQPFIQAWQKEWTLSITLEEFCAQWWNGIFQSTNSPKKKCASKQNHASKLQKINIWFPHFQLVDWHALIYYLSQNGSFKKALLSNLESWGFPLGVCA